MKDVLTVREVNRVPLPLIQGSEIESEEGPVLTRSDVLRTANPLEILVGLPT